MQTQCSRLRAHLASAPLYLMDLPTCPSQTGVTTLGPEAGLGVLVTGWGSGFSRVPRAPGGRLRLLHAEWRGGERGPPGNK